MLVGMSRWGPVALTIVLLFGALARAQLAGRYALGGGLRHFDYNEDLPSPYQSREVGFIPSYRAELHFFPWGRDGIDLSIAAESVILATTKYEGSELESGRPVTHTDIHSIHDITVEAMIPLTSRWSLIIAETYHYWHRYLAYGTGYHEVYSWFIFELGARVQLTQGPVAWAATASVRPTHNGRIDINFSDYVQAGENSRMDLGARTGFRLKGDADILLQTGWIFRLTPWYEQSSIGASDRVYNGTPTTNGPLGFIYEPASTTQQIGLGILLLRDF